MALARGEESELAEVGGILVAEVFAIARAWAEANRKK
jgi:hypothetical protein